MLLGASAAQAQTGGVPGGTEPAPSDPSTQTAGSWTVYKKATWYGPGFWGKRTACGTVLQPTVIGVAHRKLPCGTQVTFSHDGAERSGDRDRPGPDRKATPGT